MAYDEYKSDVSASGSEVTGSERSRSNASSLRSGDVQRKTRKKKRPKVLNVEDDDQSQDSFGAGLDFE